MPAPNDAAERTRMVQTQLAERGIQDPRVLAAMERIPRHRFVLPEDGSRAYEDSALSIGCGATISQPYMVAKMTQDLRLTGTEKILEVGTGSGYQTAVLCELAGEVHTIERIPELLERAKKILAELGCTPHFHLGDGSLGLPEEASPSGSPRTGFDRILVAAGAPSAPQTLLDQLAPGGLLVIPVGDERGQLLTIFTKDAHGGIRSRRSTHCIFVPLVGQQGWQDPV